MAHGFPPSPISANAPQCNVRAFSASLVPFALLASLAALCALLFLPAQAPAQVSVVRSILLDPENGNYPPLDDLYSTHAFGTIAIAPNGTVGMLHRDVSGGGSLKDVRMTLHEYDITATLRSDPVNLIQTSSPNNQPMATLAYDGNSRPHVFCRIGGTTHHYTRDAGVAWVDEPVVIDLASYFGGQQPPLGELFRAIRGLDNRVHLIFSARLSGGAPLLFQATLDPNGWWIRNHGAYQTLLSDGAFAFQEFFEFQVDASRRLHVCFSASEPSGDPGNLPRQRLNWGRSAGAGWTVEVVRQGADADDKPATNAHMALDRNGNPFLLSHHTTHDPTGSMLTATLYYYIRTSVNTWNREMIAETADGYVGGDGNRFTGEYPHLTFDAFNRPHVVFSDIASWHWNCAGSESCNDQIRGQLRYAWKNGAAWNTFTLFAQPGQSASPNPLNLFESGAVAVSPGGSRVYAYGMEHIHHSTTVAYDPEAARDYRVQFVEARNTLGSDPPALFQTVLLHILGYPVIDDTLDQNGDGAVDIADGIGVLLSP